MSTIELRVLKDISDAIENDSLILPTLPEVALQAREVANDPDSSIGDLAKVISNDIAITARLVKIANSPLVRGSSKVEDLRTAVNRLGLSFTSNLVTSMAMEQMFQATTDLVDKKMRDIWEHSTQISGIAHVLCRHYSKLRPDQATLAGLVATIGALPILTYAEAHPELLEENGILDRLINDLHQRIGTVILTSWEFPDDMVQIPGHYTDFSRTGSSNPDYVDLVLVAHLQSLRNSDHPHAQLDWHQIPAFRKLGLDPDLELTDVEDLSDEMDTAMAMLKQSW